MKSLEKSKISPMEMFRTFGRGGTIVLTGTFLIHSFAEIVRILLASSKEGRVLNGEFVAEMFSFHMLPNLSMYAILIITGYTFYRKMRQMMILMNEAELKEVRENTIMKTSQTLTSMVVSNIADHNRDIKEWIESRREKGKDAPKKLEEASNNIGNALNALSEVSFVLPYTNENLEIEDYQEYLEMLMSGERGQEILQ